MTANLNVVESQQIVSTDLKNILIVKLSAIGDVIHALPVSHAIKKTFPDAKITWVVEPPALEIVKMNPCVDNIILFHKKDFRSFMGFAKKFIPFRREIQDQYYDAVLDLQGLFKSAAIAFFAKSDIKLGICDMRELSGKISKPVVGDHCRGHIVDRYLDTAKAIGCEIDEVKFPLEIPEAEEIKAKEVFQRAGGNLEVPYVIFVIGANWPNKRWSIDHFALLSDWLYNMNVMPVFVGNGPVDEQRAADIEAMIEIPPINLVNKTNWAQLASLIKNSRLVIGGDTGAVHLAAALGTRTLMLMGPTDANRNGAYGQIENSLEVDRPCKGCWKRSCPKGADCLEKITVRQVEEKIINMK